MQSSRVELEYPLMIVMFIIMALPLLGLALFYMFPLGVSVPAYLFLLVISGFMYYGMYTVMGKKRKVRTGFQKMIGGKAVVLEDLDPEGKVQIDYEIWTASSRGERFLKGEKVRICGHKGLTLIVKGPGKTCP